TLHIVHRFILFFFFNHPSPSFLYTLSLHDALPIFLISLRSPTLTLVPAFPAIFVPPSPGLGRQSIRRAWRLREPTWSLDKNTARSEEHTSELQSPYDLVCRLLLEKKKYYK